MYRVLDLDNVSDACSTLDDDERNTIVSSDGIHGNPNMLVVSDSGLYSLVLRSRKENARALRKWTPLELSAQATRP